MAKLKNYILLDNGKIDFHYITLCICLFYKLFHNQTKIVSDTTGSPVSTYWVSLLHQWGERYMGKGWNSVILHFSVWPVKLLVPYQLQLQSLVVYGETVPGAGVQTCPAHQRDKPARILSASWTRIDLQAREPCSETKPQRREEILTAAWDWHQVLSPSLLIHSDSREGAEPKKKQSPNALFLFLKKIYATLGHRSTTGIQPTQIL